MTKNKGKTGEYIQAEYQDDDMMPKGDLTEFDPKRRFVIYHKTGKIKTVFEDFQFNYVMTRLVNGEKRPLRSLRRNKYGDILIMK